MGKMRLYTTTIRQESLIEIRRQFNRWFSKLSSSNIFYAHFYLIQLLLSKDTYESLSITI